MQEQACRRLCICSEQLVTSIFWDRCEARTTCTQCNLWYGYSLNQSVFCSYYPSPTGCFFPRRRPPTSICSEPPGTSTFYRHSWATTSGRHCSLGSSSDRSPGLCVCCTCFPSQAGCSCSGRPHSCICSERPVTSTCRRHAWARTSGRYCSWGYFHSPDQLICCICCPSQADEV